MSLDITPHPYYPTDAHINGYSVNETPVLTLLAVAGGASTALLGTTLALTSFLRPSLSKADKIAILWFVLSGTLHCFFEGYFIFNHDRMAPAQDFVGQLWKEYALSDSRYMTSDTLVLCLETITVFLWGPICYFVAYTIFTQNALRHPFQLIVCMSHLYGDTLYYATSLFDHYVNARPYSRPEGYYFWIYYIFMNFIWIVVPFCGFRTFAAKYPVCKLMALSRLFEPEYHHYLRRFQGAESNFDPAQVPIVIDQ
ncbi:hypothetical protein MW887_009649 [Aspergillus wentii]|nr:hypothetical protein MW887_009649 [Aspergillus wentii]